MQNPVLPPTMVTVTQGTVKSQKRRRRRNRKTKKNQAAKSRSPKKQTTRPALRGARKRVEEFRLSPCSKLYLKALIDPFSLEGGSACIPDDLDVPSFKFLTVSRGTMNVGAQQVGFVLMRTDPANDANTVFQTLSTFAGTTIPAIGTVGTATSIQTQSPFGSAQFGNNGFQWRCVGSGLRIRYTGTELNRSGRVVPFRSQYALGTATLVGFNASNFLARPEVPSIPVTRNWSTVTLLPQVNLGAGNDYSYTQQIDSYVVGAQVLADLGFFIDGSTVGNGFEWEIYSHYEVIAAQGQVSPAGVTRSHSDMPGLSAVRDVLETNMPAGESTGYDLEYYLKLIKDYGPTDMSHVVSGLYRGGQMVAPYLLTY